ncbi:hypothetical protein D3C74_315850 [compost metagenome]
MGGYAKHPPSANAGAYQRRVRIILADMHAVGLHRYSQLHIIVHDERDLVLAAHLAKPHRKRHASFADQGASSLFAELEQRNAASNGLA